MSSHYKIRCSTARRRWAWLIGLLLALFWATPAQAQNGVIVRTPLGLPGLQSLCLIQNCTVFGALDGSLDGLFLLTTPLDPQTLVNVVVLLPGILNAEVDQVLTWIGSANLVSAPLSTTLLSDRTPRKSAESLHFCNLSASRVYGTAERNNLLVLNPGRRYDSSGRRH